MVTLRSGYFLWPFYVFYNFMSNSVIWCETRSLLKALIELSRYLDRYYSVFSQKQKPILVFTYLAPPSRVTNEQFF